MRARRVTVLALCTGLMSICLLAQNPPATSGQTPANLSGSPASKIGVFVDPQKEQTIEQQANDEGECYTSAQQQTGIDPAAPPPAPPEAEKKKGGRLRAPLAEQQAEQLSERSQGMLEPELPSAQPPGRSAGVDSRRRPISRQNNRRSNKGKHNSSKRWILSAEPFQLA